MSGVTRMKKGYNCIDEIQLLNLILIFLHISFKAYLSLERILSDEHKPWRNNACVFNLTEITNPVLQGFNKFYKITWCHSYCVLKTLQESIADGNKTSTAKFTLNLHLHSEDDLQ